jgi:hypothetical protein
VLLTRLAALEEERAILDALYRYGHAIDYGLEKEWVDCFAPEGAFEMRHRLAADGVSTPSGRWDATDRRLMGREELLRFVAGHTRAPDRYHKHVVIEPRITIDDGRATVQSYFLFVEELEGRCQIGAFGRYLDELTKCEDGRWRFVQRIAEIEAS